MITKIEDVSLFFLKVLLSSGTCGSWGINPRWAKYADERGFIGSLLVLLGAVLLVSKICNKSISRDD